MKLAIHGYAAAIFCVSLLGCGDDSGTDTASGTSGAGSTSGASGGSSDGTSTGGSSAESSASGTSVERAEGGPSIRGCEPVPKGCEADRTCACVGETLCTVGLAECTDVDNLVFCDSGLD